MSETTPRSRVRAERTLDAMALCELAGRRPAALRVPSAAIEVGIVILLYIGYAAARSLVAADPSTAIRHAHELLRLERVMHVDVELSANLALQSVPVLAVIASYWYALLHYLVTPLVLIWAYRVDKERYRHARNVLVSGSVIGFVMFTLVPMAPPRMLPGYVDTLASTAAHGWWSTNASAPRGLGSLTNELAAMPSLHVGWALWCAWVVIGISAGRTVRTLAIAYALATTVVVIASANHYVLDAVAGVAVMVLAIKLAELTRHPARLPDEPRARSDGSLLAGPGT